MKVIVINDSDGHTSVLEYTGDNMRWLLGALLKSDQRDECRDVALAKEMLQHTDRPPEYYEAWMHDNFQVLNDRHGQVHILEPAKTWGSYSPFD